MSNKSLNNKIQFYFDIAFEDGLKEIQASYREHPYFKENGFTYIPGNDVYLHTDIIEEDGAPPEMRLEEIDREKFLRLQLKWKRSEIIEELNHTKPSKTDLKELYDQLKIVLEEVQKKSTQDEFYKIVLEEIKSLINRLKATFSELIEYHPVFKFTQELNLSESFFESKDLHISFFKTLYHKAIDTDLIDDVINSEVDFIEVFTSPTPTATIQFRQPNPIIAYYLDKIAGFFYNLNPKRIEEAKTFKNKQGKLLKASDIYNAKKRPTKDLSRWEKKIDSSIDPLIAEYQI